AETSDDARVEKHLTQSHYQDQHRNKSDDTEQIEAPGQIETEQRQVARLKIEQEMVANSFAGKVRVLGWKIVSDGKALNDRGVRSEVAPLIVADQQSAILVTERGAHHPARHREEGADRGPIP